MSNYTQGRYRNMVEKRHELFDGLVAHIITELVALGVNPEAADLCANATADMISDVWGGQTFAIPMDHQRKLSIKEIQAWQYNECHSIDETAKHFKMSVRGMYKLMTRMRKRIEKQRKGEPSLF